MLHHVFGVTPVQLTACLATVVIVVLHRADRLSLDGTLKAGVALHLAEVLGQNASKQSPPDAYGPVRLDAPHS